MTDSIPTLSPTQIGDWFSSLPKQDFTNQRILLIIPAESPRTLPLIFDAFFREIRPLCLALDVIVALGEQPPISDSQISKRLGINETERGRLFFQTQFFNHDCDRDDRLDTIGTLTSAKSAELTRGLLSVEIPVQVNSRVQDYDLLVVLSQVFPERSLGYSGGNVCFFPGLGGRDILTAIEHVSALNCDDTTIGTKDTPVRRLVDGASSLICQKRRAITFLTACDGSLCGLFYDTPESAWNAAADLLDRCG